MHERQKKPNFKNALHQSLFMEIIYIIVGLLLGGLITFLWLRTRVQHPNEYHQLKEEQQSLEFQLVAEKEKYNNCTEELYTAKELISSQQNELRELDATIAIIKTKLEATESRHENCFDLLEKEKENSTFLERNNQAISLEKAELNIQKDTIAKENLKLSDTLEKTELALKDKVSQYHELHNLYSKEQANHLAVKEKLATQKLEVEALTKKFNLEFQNIANKILEEKAEKFTHVNQKNLESILHPLGENINAFKKQVTEAYNTEAKERFSLEQQVKEMAKLNKIISDEARNLTNALKGEAKTQGRWGEMILESILEKSGLRKGEEYFLEHQLSDDDGKPLRSDTENKKMRPDALIKYPDNRSVIIDSKVSLNAFTRYLDAEDKITQDIALKSHVDAIKAHINTLSAKGYDDYNKALDFVLMFVPSEPAYIAALQGDAELWNYAYSKRILLINPTNLITALKLIVDLWKREYQNQNALQIAERGAKLYDKFAGFIKNLDDVGTNLEKATSKYNEAYKQLSTGNDNLVLQANKLKKLGIKNKKELNEGLVNQAMQEEIS